MQVKSLTPCSNIVKEDIFINYWQNTISQKWKWFLFVNCWFWCETKYNKQKVKKKLIYGNLMHSNWILIFFYSVVYNLPILNIKKTCLSMMKIWFFKYFLSLLKSRDMTIRYIHICIGLDLHMWKEIFSFVLVPINTIWIHLYIQASKQKEYSWIYSCVWEFIDIILWMNIHIYLININLSLIDRSESKLTYLFIIVKMKWIQLISKWLTF